MIQLFKKRWVYHSLIWLLAYMGLTAIIYFDERNTDSLLECLQEPISFFVPVIVATYLGFWVKERFFDSRQYLLYFLGFVAVIAVGVILYEAIEAIGLQESRSGNTRSNNITNFIFIQLFTVGLQYFKRGITNQYQLQELRAKTAMTELNALKAQINPHFLFNTLNNIYGMNQIDSEKGSEMIMELSDVMRYHLEFSKAGKVRLEDEIQLLQSYIKLEQLRLSETCEVKVDFAEANESLMISPLLFIPFVENAFKHGTHPTQECFVHIQLRTTTDRLFFTIENSIITNRKVVKTNIGLQNTKRRLELIFPEKHDLKISKDEHVHLVELEIRFKN
ncbi:MAG: sensor histidine kinase [Saprospiraceae bacterium]